METKYTPFDKAPVPDLGTKFADMTRAQKWVFVAKLIVCIGTFGYVFPHVQSS